MKDSLGKSLLVFMGGCELKVLASQWEGQQKGFSWLARKKVNRGISASSKEKRLPKVS